MVCDQPFARETSPHLNKQQDPQPQAENQLLTEVMCTLILGWETREGPWSGHNSAEGCGIRRGWDHAAPQNGHGGEAKVGRQC